MRRLLQTFIYVIRKLAVKVEAAVYAAQAEAATLRVACFPGYHPGWRWFRSPAELSSVVYDRLQLILSRTERDAVARFIDRSHPEWRESSIRRANEVLSHTFSVLGAKVVVRGRVDWHKDYLSGRRWPVRRKRALSRAGAGRGADIKVPWELSRFHQGVVLGKAYALTGNEDYAQEFVAEMRDWVAQNPPYRGINWTCAMEAGIRAANLIWSMALLQGSRALTLDVIQMFHRTLYFHGLYIRGNLERNVRIVGATVMEVNGNHFVFDIVGLLYVAILMQGTVPSSQWLRVALSGLDQILRTQIGPDGVHYEYSPNYHRLVLEALCHATVLSQRADVTPPERMRASLDGMTTFVEHYTKNDGSAPLLRDIDSGRFVILGEESLTDHRHVAAVCSKLLGRGTTNLDCEDALWLLGVRPRPESRARQKVAALESRAFGDSGIYCLRSPDMQVLIVCSPTGMHGFCGHAHNDALSFELSAYGRNFLVDSGSYVYTRYPEWRNRFRSTAYHNTAVIDDQEVNALSETDMFNIGNGVTPTVTLWRSDGRVDILHAEYTVARRCGTVTHRRAFEFFKRECCLRITDSFTGEGSHRIRLFHHLDCGLSVQRMSAGGIAITEAGARALMVVPALPAATRTAVSDGWLSRTYGSREARKVVSYTYEGGLEAVFSFTLVPACADGAERRSTSAGRLRRTFLSAASKCQGLRAPY